MYETSSATASDIDLTQSDPVAWRVLHQLDTTTDAVSAMAYHLRILTHLLAVADHRHLDGYTADLIAAVDTHDQVRGQLDVELAAARQAWGLLPGTSLREVVDAAPAAVVEALRTAMEGLRTVTEELREDGTTANALAEAAVRIVEQRCAGLERGLPGTYRAESGRTAGR